nr:MAG TPA: hypothetical protein [Caudoviricetes sp.]
MKIFLFPLYRVSGQEFRLCQVFIGKALPFSFSKSVFIFFSFSFNYIT